MPSHEGHDSLGITAALAIGLVSAAAAIAPPSCGDTTGPGSTDVPCKCGDTVTTDTTLTNLDPVVTAPCPSRGLTVAGIHLNLGGKTIAGSGNEGGLFLTGDGGSVSNGRITGFATGIASGFASPISGWEIVRQTPVVAGGLRVTGNAIGILLVADDTDITDVAATGNGAGVIVFGSGNSVVRISCSSNRGPAGADGLSIVGDHNSLEHNRCEKNGRDGIAVLGDNNILIRNQATANGRGGRGRRRRRQRSSDQSRHQQRRQRRDRRWFRPHYGRPQLRDGQPRGDELPDRRVPAERGGRYC